MKTHKFNLALILFLSISFGLMARTEVKKEYHERYSTDKNTSFTITNRYGKIEIMNSLDDEMSIDVEVKVEASSEKKAQDILEQIEIILANDHNKIVALTKIDGKGWSGNVNLNIDYTINMPSYINTTLENKYGSVEIANITGHFRGEVKYGSFSANKLSPDDNSFINGLYLAYCSNSNIRHFDKMSLELAYSKLKLDHGDALEFEAKYSDLKIGEVALISGELAYTDCRIEAALNIDIEAKYSDIDFGTVLGSLEVETKYGDLDVGKLGKDFELVKIEAGYSDVDISVEKGALYKLSLDASYGDISFPNMHVERLDDEGTDKSVFGYVGEHSNTENAINISTRYGDIDISSY